LEVEENTICNENALQPLLQNLQKRYQEWLRECPSNVSQYSSVNSIRRNHFGFELVEHKG
ncbi:2037_t:CDS:2, partial [Gigaspora rosea]